jgi:hypothetical protein
MVKGLERERERERGGEDDEESEGILGIEEDNKIFLRSREKR